MDLDKSGNKLVQVISRSRSPNFDFLASVFRADLKNHKGIFFWGANFWQMGTKVLNYTNNVTFFGKFQNVSSKKGS